MKIIKLKGSNTFVSGNQKGFDVYYYVHKDETTQTYGIRLEKTYDDSRTEIEYEEEKYITESSVLAEELVDFLINYKVTPVSLPESLDVFLDQKEQENYDGELLDRF